MKKPILRSPVAQSIREAAGAGNHFAQFLIQSRDYFAEKNERHRKERVLVSLQKKLACTKHSKCRQRIERQLERMREAE
ncbi:hypothetical protein [Pseudobacillus badius]|uniref:hypothetical protein n=1 Tax=Bacillus badius TaxID=1455 RepID=UPI00249FDE49|nr:hypothetical protein [Bacillus badius]GLY09579.1 hypothetical protein Bbad01_07950 [Bacillus badius]